MTTTSCSSQAKGILMVSKLTGQLHQELTTPSNAESKRTITINDKTVKIAEKYMKGRSCSATTSYLIEMADELFAEFAHRSNRKTQEEG